jgi:hypothetical protein
MINTYCLSVEGVGFGSFAVATLGFLELKVALTINMVGIESKEAFGRPKIRWAEPIPAYIGLRRVYIPHPIEVTLKSIKSVEAFGRPEIRLNLNVQGIQSEEVFGQSRICLDLKVRNIRSIEKFGKPITVADRGFIENLEEEEALTLFLLAA